MNEDVSAFWFLKKLAMLVMLGQSVSLAHADNWNITVSRCRDGFKARLVLMLLY